jgi:REP element-mobilizing transposase RayT
VGKYYSKSMARKPRIELEGGLYHVITRGNDRKVIFHQPADYKKFLSLLELQKLRLPFFLYAYCLMPNHVHLLLERQRDAVGRIMHRLLTGYARYYNRRYGSVGHVLQGRYKAFLCQSDTYLCRLVRYIHLNPVRAGMVAQPQDYSYSSHQSYLGLVESHLVDVDPILRHFSHERATAREQFQRFVCSGSASDHIEECYRAVKRQFGQAEFADENIHRLGETSGMASGSGSDKSGGIDANRLVTAVEEALRTSRQSFFGSRKHAPAVMAKEALILFGRDRGAKLQVLADITGLTLSTVSRRYDAAKCKLQDDERLRLLIDSIRDVYDRD